MIREPDIPLCNEDCRSETLKRISGALQVLTNDQIEVVLPSDNTGMRMCFPCPDFSSPFVVGLQMNVPNRYLRNNKLDFPTVSAYWLSRTIAGRVVSIRFVIKGALCSPHGTLMYKQLNQRRPFFANHQADSNVNLSHPSQQASN